MLEKAPCQKVQHRTFVPAGDKRAAFCEPAVALEATAAVSLGAWNISFLWSSRAALS